MEMTMTKKLLKKIYHFKQKKSMQITLNDTELYILRQKIADLIKSEPSDILAQVLMDIHRRLQ